MTQRTDRQVEADARRFNATTEALRRGLRRAGIRNVHTSPKAAKAIARASIRPSRPAGEVGR